MTGEGRTFAGEMSRGPGRARIEVHAFTGCDCGCGRPVRVELKITGGGRSVGMYVDTPGLVDALISVLQESREKLWGPPLDPQ